MKICENQIFISYNDIRKRDILSQKNRLNLFSQVSVTIKNCILVFFELSTKFKILFYLSKFSQYLKDLELVLPTDLLKFAP